MPVRGERAKVQRKVPTTASGAESDTTAVLQLTMNAYELLLLYFEV